MGVVACGLEKVAAAVKELVEGAARLGNTHVIGSAPTMWKRLMAVPEDVRLGAHAIAAQTPMGSGFTPAQARVVRARMPQAIDAAPAGVHPGMAAWARRGREGQIWSIGEQGVAKALPHPTRGPLQGEDAKALHASGMMHEQYERAVPARRLDADFLAVYGHGHPEVLLKEHNLVHGMTGPGASGARETLTHLRANRLPANPAMRGRMPYTEGQFTGLLLQDTLGAPAVEMYQRGEKFNRGMRKAFNRRYEKLRGGALGMPARPQVPAPVPAPVPAAVPASGAVSVPEIPPPGVS